MNRMQWSAAAAAVAWSLMLWGLSSQPLDGGNLDFRWRFAGDDKLVHAAFYAVLGGLLRLAGVRLPLAVLLVAAIGSVDEFAVQARIPARDADPWDLLADVVGGTLGALVAARWLRRTTRAR
jgi:hypothetical protein